MSLMKRVCDWFPDPKYKKSAAYLAEAKLIDEQVDTLLPKHFDREEVAKFIFEFAKMSYADAEQDRDRMATRVDRSLTFVCLMIGFGFTAVRATDRSWECFGWITTGGMLALLASGLLLVFAKHAVKTGALPTISEVMKLLNDDRCNENSMRLLVSATLNQTICGIRVCNDWAATFLATAMLLATCGGAMLVLDSILEMMLGHKLTSASQ